MAENQWKDYLEKQGDLLAKGIITEREYKDAVKDANVQMIGYSAAMRASTKQLGTSVLGLGSAIVKGEKGASVYNNSINSMADAIASIVSMIPYVGKLLGEAVKAGAKYVTAVNEQADALFETYQGLTRSGLATGMRDVFDNLHGMGYTIKELGDMSALLKENVDTLANFGGTAAQGAKAFTEVAGGIQNSEISQGFKRMGMSVGDINKSVAGYMRIQRTSGVLSNQTNEQLTASAAKYIDEQDRLTKLTGLAAEQQNQIVLNALAEQRYAATQRELKDDGTEKSAKLAQRNDELLVMFTSQFGSKTSRAFQDYASGMMNSEDAAKFQRSFPKAADMIRNGTGTVTEIAQLASEDAQETVKTYTNLAKADSANERLTDFSELAKGQASNLKGTAEERNEAAKKQQKEQKDGKDKAVANMVDLTTAQRNQTQAFEHLINKGIEPVTKGLATVVGGITKATGIVGSVAGRKDQMGGGDAASGGKNEVPTASGGSAGPPELAVVSIQGKSTQVGKPYAPAFQSLLDSLDKVGYKIKSLGGYVDRDVRGQPGKKSVHALGGAIDINPDANPLGGSLITDMPENISQMAAAAGLGWGGNWKSRKDAMHFSAARSEGGSLIPSAAKGGVISGPASGYDALLHGNEAVVPMKDKQSIPVEAEDTSQTEQIKLLSQKIMTLDNLINTAKKNIDTSERILKKQH